MPASSNDNAYLRPATYDVRRKVNGTWTVYVVATGLPALVNEIKQTGMDVEDVDDLMD